MTEDSIDGFIESFRKLEQEIALGSSKAYLFVGGPHNGRSFNIEAEFGIPRKLSITLPVDMVWKRKELIPVAFYEYEISKDVFQFTGKIENQVYAE